MEPGVKRTTIARITEGFAFFCGVIGLLAGITDHMWKLSPLGWFSSGALLSLIGLFVLVDGAVSFGKSRIIVVPKH